MDSYKAAMPDPNADPWLRRANAMRTVQVVEQYFERSFTASNPTSDRAKVKMLPAYKLTVNLVSRITRLDCNLRKRLLALSTTEDLSARAEFHVLHFGRPEYAVELLEEGRTVFWRQCVRLHTPFTEIPPEFAAILRAASRRLENDRTRETLQLPHLTNAHSALMEKEKAS